MSQTNKQLNLTAFLIALGSIVNLLLARVSAMGLLPDSFSFFEGLTALFLIATVLCTLGAIFMRGYRLIMLICLLYSAASTVFNAWVVLQISAAC